MERALLCTTPRPYTGTFDIDTGEFDPLSEHVEYISLPSSDFKFGFLKGHQSESAACLKRHPTFIMFTTDINFGNSMSPDEKVYYIYGYLFKSWQLNGYWYQYDQKLSPDEFYGTVAGGSWRSRIKSCFIENDNIKITWYNPGTANKSRAYFKGSYFVWR
ncbi:MAG: hypothetical protein ACTSRA_00330 [Promethearchaeota archaeon]|nr:MAG: hypothetical protein [Helarchaeota virus Nidhogg Meg22_1012]URC17401.1 MAG: hypothetical protein [Helarchaeota virus Nidhogg Meg22_1214]